MRGLAVLLCGLVLILLLEARPQPLPPGVVIALGDSITAGQGAPPADAWPAQLQRLDPSRRVITAGIRGNTVAWEGHCPPCGPPMVDRLSRDVLQVRQARLLVLLGGINDLLQGGSAPEVVAGLAQIATRAQAAGLLVIGMTLLPFGRARPWSPALEAQRQAVNAWIRTSGAFDRVVDAAALLRDPAHPTWLRPAASSPDGLHPNGAGYAVLARAIAALMRS